MKEQTPEQQEIERKIREAAEGAHLITFGYIGNFERWGDDRRLFLWISNMRGENGNLKSIWSCNSVELNRQELANARIALRHFKEGYDAAKKGFETK